MKKYFYLFLSLILLSACSKKGDNEVKPAYTKQTIKDAGAIVFKAAPLSDHELRLNFIDTGNEKLAKVILKQGNTTLATMPVVYGDNGSVSATFSYDFKPGTKYSFIVQAAVVSTTINQYSIPEYVHSFVSAYNYQKVFTSNSPLGPNDFDISPARNYLFLSDDLNNVVTLKRISLKTLSVENINFEVPGQPVRAVSDNELLVYGDKNTANLPPVADAGYDAVVLARFNIDTKKMNFVDYFSSGYGRISRVINNHVLITNPIFTAETASLINLADLSKVKYSLNDFAFELIDQFSFGHIIYNNMLVNPSTGKFIQPLALDANSGLVDIDDATGYGFAQSYTLGPQQAITSFSIYKNKAVVYQSDRVQGRSVFFPIIYNIQNDVVTYYQSFGYDTKVNIDGYYTLNIKTGETKLVQADSNPYVISDYQLKDGSVFSVRADGVYKLTHK
jgi:hypothetical protein